VQEKRILEKCDTRHKDRRMEWLVVEKKNGKEIYQWTSQEPDLTNKANIVTTQAGDKRSATLVSYLYSMMTSYFKNHI
jgi:predicted DCC family thiol-disulfide oxidoreductase YuxK